MIKLSDEIIHFFQRQDFVIVSTIDENGSPHNACKGVLYLDPKGKVYLLDVYLEDTHSNMERNPKISITAVEGHKFRGYCLKGQAQLLENAQLTPEVIKAWEEKITARISKRLLRNLHGEEGHPKHPEALLPDPKYIFILNVEEIIDLTPRHLKEGVHA